VVTENEKLRSAEEPAGRGRLLWARFGRSIGVRLLVRVVLFSSAITLTLMQLYFDYRRDVGIIEDRLAEIEHAYLPRIAESLWELDERQIALHLEGILRLPDMRAAEVREATDRPAPLLVTIGQRQERSRLAREIPILHSVAGAIQPIGSLYVEATLVGSIAPC
jgi:Periplasmic sensor domain found in signal transduction proteins